MSNVFTNGGLRNPTCQAWAIGGASQWWLNADEIPETAIASSNHHSTLQGVARYKCIGEGLQIWQEIAGTISSSTRTEVTAAAGVLQKPVAPRLGSESENLVNKADAMNDMPLECERKVLPLPVCPFKAPWPMHNDGDLWVRVWHLIGARGAQAQVFQWVRGHVTDAMIKSGRFSRANKHGNDMSDQSATHGIESRDTGVLALAIWLAERHKKYIKLTARIQMCLVKVRQAESNVLNKKGDHF